MPSVRLLQHAHLVAVGVRERAFHVAEQLRLEEGLRDAGAVHRHQRLSCPAGMEVDELRDQILADAAFPRDQNLGIAFGHALCETADRLDHGATADDQRLGGNALGLGRAVRGTTGSHSATSAVPGTAFGRFDVLGGNRVHHLSPAGCPGALRHPMLCIKNTLHGAIVKGQPDFQRRLRSHSLSFSGCDRNRPGHTTSRIWTTPSHHVRADSGLLVAALAPFS